MMRLRSQHASVIIGRYKAAVSVLQQLESQYIELTASLDSYMTCLHGSGKLSARAVDAAGAPEMTYLCACLTFALHRPVNVNRFANADVQTAELCSMFSADLCAKRAIVAAMLPVWCYDAPGDVLHASQVRVPALTFPGELSEEVLHHSHPAGLAPRQEADRDHLTALVSAWAASPALADHTRIDSAAVLLEFLGSSL